MTDEEEIKRIWAEFEALEKLEIKRSLQRLFYWLMAISLLAILLSGCQWRYVAEHHDPARNYGRPEGVTLIETKEELYELLKGDEDG